MALFFKGALCNWLVCLAIWIGVTEGAAKFIAIWWCLLAFIASGYEHSVANMTLFALSWFGLMAMPSPFRVLGITCCG
jgi:nitrite transporter NirC